MQEQNTHNQPQPQPVPQPQPGYAPQPPQMGVPAQYGENPGQTLGIVGIVLNVMGISIGGIILGVMSRNKSRQAGMSTTLGTVSMVWGIISTVLAVLAVSLFILLAIIGAATSDTSSPSSYSSYTNDF